jgi:hypothetical protein
MVKISKFVTIEVNKRKYKLTTTDLKKLYKIDKNKCPSIPFYDITNLHENIDS